MPLPRAAAASNQAKALKLAVPARVQDTGRVNQARDEKLPESLDHQHADPQQPAQLPSAG